MTDRDYIAELQEELGGDELGCTLFKLNFKGKPTQEEARQALRAIKLTQEAMKKVTEEGADPTETFEQLFDTLMKNP